MFPGAMHHTVSINNRGACLATHQRKEECWNACDMQQRYA